MGWRSTRSSTPGPGGATPIVSGANGKDAAEEDAMKVTLLTVRDDQIRALRSEASAVSDLAMVIVCDRALGGTDMIDDYMPPEQHERKAVLRALDMTQDEARAECVCAINEGQG